MITSSARCGTSCRSYEPRGLSKKSHTLDATACFRRDTASASSISSCSRRSTLLLTAAILAPFPGDLTLAVDRISRLDKLYLAVTTALDNLLDGIGLKAACISPYRVSQLTCALHVHSRSTLAPR